MAEVTCTRCGNTREGLERPPLPGPLGARAKEEICGECWKLWLKQQTMLINHYGLNLMDPQARQFLTKNMDTFLFKTGKEEEQVDTSKQGTINW
jgi:Fe-S cluster biosynthesis and repair protein YggX